MKSDTLTLAAVAVVIGIIATGLAQLEVFSANSNTEAPTELQRGFQHVSQTYERSFDSSASSL